ncbi:MAG: hypothetical protein ACM4AI_19155 [Acidobacteriota bacterium]
MSDLHGHGALLKVLVDRTPAVADVEGDVIATRIFAAISGGVLSGVSSTAAAI